MASAVSFLIYENQRRFCLKKFDKHIRKLYNSLVIYEEHM